MLSRGCLLPAPSGDVVDAFDWLLLTGFWRYNVVNMDVAYRAMRGCTWLEPVLGSFEWYGAVFVLGRAGIELFSEEAHGMHQHAHHDSTVVALCDFD